jgi:RNA polymerase sigma factor (sigma-70 family)
VSAQLRAGEPPPDEKDFEGDYGKLVEIQWPRLLTFCLFWGRSRAEAEDIVQEAFLRFHERRARVQRPAPYLRATVVRLLTRTAREYPQPDVGAATAIDRCGIDEFLGHDLTRTALEQLPERQRKVLALDLVGFVTQEIAALLDMEPATVRSNLRHARGVLRPWWTAQFGEEDPR